MVVAVVAMDMVQVAIDQIIDVIPMRYGLVAAVRTVAMSLIVFAAIVVRRTVGGIVATHFQTMLLDSPAGRMVQMAIVQVVNVTIVLDSRVTAFGTMLVRMVRVMIGHFLVPRFLGFGARCFVN
jgi:hypothetical protein